MSLAPQVSTVISHYRLVEPLGRGAMGEVWLAEDLQLPRKVAIKLLSEQLSEDPEAANRMLREAQAAASVDHPGVVAVYEAGLIGRRPYLVMQRVEGETLADRLKRGPLPLDEALLAARQVADALAEVHALGIVHRDLKPSNLILTGRGARILDFGVASMKGATQLTRMGAVVGTPSAMSPEQVRGQTSDNRSDLWALGVLLYTMLAGRPPFVGETADAVCYQILNDSPKPPSALRSGVSSELDYVVLKLLRKDPAMRYGRAEDLVADLTSLMGPASAPAEPQPSTPRLAVVPFEVMGADSDDVFLAQGLAEDLIVDLTRLGGLRVASRAEVAPYRERSVPPRTLARELGADYVLLGSVRRAGNRARISAQLVRASDGNTTWADRFDRTLDDLFEVQAEVSKHIVEALQVTLRADEREMLDRAPSHDVAAYALYLQARELIDVTSETNREAERLLQKALALDERFPLALAALGETYAIRGMRWWASPDEAARLARPFAERALALEPDLVDAHLVLARVHRLTGDTEAFTAAIERVLATDPDHQEAVEYAAWCYLSRGTPGRALPLLERAAERDRASYRGLTFLENAYEMLHRVEDAERTALRANEARLEHVRRHPGREGAHARSQVAVRLMVVGQMEEGKRQMRLALAADPDDGRLHYNAACAYARAGLHEEAIAELRAGVQGLTSFLGDWPLHDPDLESVRDHPEFVRLFGRVGPGG